MLNTGSETTVQALGQSWTISKLHLLKVTREFCLWVRDRLPDPIGDIGEKYFNLLPPEEQTARVKAAESIKRQLKCFTLGCDLAREYMTTEEGAAKFLQLLLLHHHPDMTVEKAFEIAMDAGEGVIQQALSRAQGDVGSGGNGAALPEQASQLRRGLKTSIGHCVSAPSSTVNPASHLNVSSS
jgi:hypothetical protein